MNPFPLHGFNDKKFTSSYLREKKMTHLLSHSHRYVIPSFLPLPTKEPYLNTKTGHVTPFTWLQQSYLKDLKEK